MSTTWLSRCADVVNLIRARWWDFDGEVEAVVTGVPGFEFFQDAAALFVMFKMAVELAHDFVERVFPAVAERRMAEVVRQSHGFT
jgi:hypothetical protein